MGILVLAIVAFFVIMTAVYFLGIKKAESPTSSTSPAPTVVDETANWKTYESSKYGYLFKYPSDWRIAQNTEDNLVIVNFPVSEERGSDGVDEVKDKGKAAIRLGISGQPPDLGAKTRDLSLDQYVNKMIKKNEAYSGKKDITKEETTVGGKPAILVNGYGFAGPFFPGATVFIEKSTSEVVFITPSLDYPSYKKVFNQILSTFKFTE